MFSSVLIANRGEIACRIIRTARALGLRTIAVFSQADTNALHVGLADEAHEIGPAAAASSYLDGARILEVAKAAGAECIHPGYGFLAENADFAAACADAGIVFVGPPADAIRAMGEKAEAKRAMERAGVPVVPGYHGRKQDARTLAKEAEKISYPLLIKAVAGGGGKGMRRVERPEDFDAALEGARREAKNAFGNDRVLIEKFVAAPRHIEIQVFADSHGNAVHLFERDCSLQRRHQKVIEEAPAPGMSEELRSAMGEAAVTAARAVGYQGAGTVEFIADASGGLKPDGFYFMEMNTRLQVEHPVTEMVTGLDLVEWQFRVAAGEPLPLAQEAIGLDGHAVEARLYAEDPYAGFLPASGRLHLLRLPPEASDLRVDTGVAEGGEVTPYYDPMIAKVIARAPRREAALERLRTALAETAVAGVRTNAGFLARLLAHRAFIEGVFDTGFIEQHLEELIDSEPLFETLALAALAWLAHLAERARYPGRRVTDEAISPWDLRSGWRLAGERHERLHLVIDGTALSASLFWDHTGCIERLGFDGREEAVSVGGFRLEGARLAAEIDGRAAEAWVARAANRLYVCAAGRQLVVEPQDLLARGIEGMEASAVVKAPMPGKVQALFVTAGTHVARGAPIAILEAMKMEHTLSAHADSTVKEVAVREGQQVEEGQVLARLEPVEENA